ncbi:MAG TPA: restriction endonuclease [Streptosporangiaceae bacterium]|nr:restriction endonuclease [Streptosporangiaceae bacterium]
MARSGGRSEWERQQAAQRREAERAAREQARLAKEREKQRLQQHLESQQRATEARTLAVDLQIKALNEVLTNILPLPPLSFERLKVAPKIPDFDPGSLNVTSPIPDWNEYAPMEPGGLSRIFGGGTRHERRTAEARFRYEAAMSDYRKAEDGRRRALAAANTEHERAVAGIRRRAAEQNATVEARRASFASGDADAVEWFVSQVLNASQYPDGFPRQYQVAYRPENRDVVVEFELPSQRAIPAVRGYKYVKLRDAIDSLPRPENEIKQRYARLIACVALRTLHEIFAATPGDVVEAVVFNGRVSTIDRATGKPARPHLLSVSAERPTFEDLVLASVEPAACLKRLNALVSPNPFDMEAVEPFIAFDLKRFRFTEDLEVVAGLDSRPNLLKLSPTEFEHLVRQLFVAMGAEAWTTIPSKDGGVDAVATSKNLFFGGVCLIQAKRWTGLVGLESVHALTGVMADHNATTGVLVTTSWFGRASEQFANRNRITLINGAELKQLIKEHLHRDVIPGTTPPRRLRASDNTQSGRIGPDGPSPADSD